MNFKKIIFTVFLLAFFQAADAGEKTVLKGQVMTGINRYLGQPVWNLGGTLGGAGFDLLYEYKPGENRSLPVDQHTSDDVILATGLNEGYISLFGLTANDIPGDLINIPLHDVPVISSPKVGQREGFDNILQVSETSNSRVFSSEEITLEEWKRGQGLAKVNCGRRSNSIRFNLYNMLPNSLYTAWAIYGVDNDADGIYDALLPRAFGGVPNVLTTNSSGNGRLFRKINTCPFSEESDLLWIEFDYHADGAVYGGVPDFTLEGYPSGIVSQSHIAFGFNVTKAD